jgi:hypothetical protein
VLAAEGEARVSAACKVGSGCSAPESSLKANGGPASGRRRSSHRGVTGRRCGGNAELFSQVGCTRSKKGGKSAGGGVLRGWRGPLVVEPAVVKG